MKISISKNGFPYILRSGIFCILSAFLCCLIGLGGFLLYIIAICILCMFIFLFRDNKNKIPSNVLCVLPSDGQIIVPNYYEQQFLGLDNTHIEIRIYSGILNKYVKYAPISGRIVNIGHSKSKKIGRFSHVEIESKTQGNFIVLIKSLVPLHDIIIPKGITSGMEINIGDEIFEAHFFSEVFLFIPNNIVINVPKLGNISIGGVTTII